MVEVAGRLILVHLSKELYNRNWFNNGFGNLEWESLEVYKQKIVSYCGEEFVSSLMVGLNDSHIPSNPECLYNSLIILHNETCNHLTPYITPIGNEQTLFLPLKTIFKTILK